MLNVKLPHLNGWSEGRRKNARLYTELFIKSGLSTGSGRTDYEDGGRVLLPKAIYESAGHRNYHIFNQFVIRVKERDELRAFLSGKEIGTEIYYPIPFHRQECFKELMNDKRYTNGEFGFSDTAATETIALPIYSELSAEQINFVVDSVKEFYGSRS